MLPVIAVIIAFSQNWKFPLRDLFDRLLIADRRIRLTAEQELELDRLGMKIQSGPNLGAQSTRSIKRQARVLNFRLFLTEVERKLEAVVIFKPGVGCNPDEDYRNYKVKKWICDALKLFEIEDQLYLQTVKNLERGMSA